MTNLLKLQDFAARHNFDLTSPLVHEQVVKLAENWLPNMFFFEKEKFHPIALEQTINMVKAIFDPLSEEEKAKWRIRLLVRTEGDNGTIRAFDPPALFLSDGEVRVPDNPPSLQFLPAVRVLNDGIPTADAFELPDADTRALITHGASFERSDKFFGAIRTVSGATEASSGNPFLPRATAVITDENGSEKEEPRITVLATFKSLFQTLKYELIVEEAQDLPADALWKGVDLADHLFRQNGLAFPFPDDLRRAILLELIAAFEAGEFPSNALDRLPPGWVLDRIAWDAVTRFAFLEYDFIYAFNDFARTQSSLFTNEHEGDNEGCCLVFDRAVINIAAASTDPDAILRAVPHSIITSVHEEFQQADQFKTIPPPIVPANEPGRLPRQDVDLNVYIAWASHATYLTPGIHDLVDLQDEVSFIDEQIPLPLIVLFPGAILILAIIAAIYEHFVDTEDFTSDTGLHTGPAGVGNEDPKFVKSEVLVIPTSAEENIYASDQKDLLRLRAFAGNWGGTNGFIDHSGPFPSKTGRYFRKLLANL